MTALGKVQTQVTAGERPESQWNQFGFADGSRYTGQVKRLPSVDRSDMEESLKKSAKACKAAAAVTAEWIRDTHRSLQKQEIRWESLQQGPHSEEITSQETSEAKEVSPASRLDRNIRQSLGKDLV